MSNILSLAFYLCFFLISSFSITRVGMLYKKRNNENKYKAEIVFFTCIGLIIPFLISALRYYVGTDYGNYIRVYNQFSGINFWELILNNHELLFITVIKISYNPQVMFAIMAFLTITILYFSIFKYKEKLSLGFMFFLYLFLFFTSSFNIMKQGLAIVIIAYSYKFIFNKELKKFLITVFIAALFHVTALIFLPFYFVHNNSKNTKKTIQKIIKIIYIILMICVVLNYNLVINWLTKISFFEEFSLYSNEVSSNNFEFIINIMLLLIILIFRKRLINYDEKNKIFIFMFIINCILMFTGYISPFIKRIALYFGISSIFLLASFPNIVKKKEQRLLVYFLISLYAIGMFVMSTFVLKHANIIPYQTIFNTI